MMSLMEDCGKKSFKGTNAKGSGLKERQDNCYLSLYSLSHCLFANLIYTMCPSIFPVIYYLFYIIF